MKAEPDRRSGDRRAENPAANIPTIRPDTRGNPDDSVHNAGRAQNPAKIPDTSGNPEYHDHDAEDDDGKSGHSRYLPDSRP